jgi:hypothetical protein
MLIGIGAGAGAVEPTVDAGAALIASTATCKVVSPSTFLSKSVESVSKSVEPAFS